MDLELKDKVVFVAGASRGIGNGIARVFLEEDARVVITGRDLTGAGLSDLPADRVLMFEGDLSLPAIAKQARDAAVERWGTVDILVCNIGSGAARNGWDLNASDWDAVFQINFWTTVRLVEVILPVMVEARRGSIVFISSIAGLESLGAPLPYGAAKAALEHYSKDLSRRVGRYDVRVNTVAPGNILFPDSTWQRKLDADRTGVTAMIDAEVPLARFGTPEEIGAAVAFLSSDRAAFITGSCLVADGGQTRA